MKRFLWLTLLVTLLGLSAQADVYVSPDEQRSMAREWLNGQLAEVPDSDRVKFVEDLLAKIPLERADLQMKVAEAEKADAKGERSGPPAYFLKKGFESINYREEVLKEWLARNKASGDTGAMLSSSHLVALFFLAGAVLLGLRRALAGGRVQGTT
jgi:hypothetical protein